MKIFKNKFFIIALSIAVFIIIFTATLSLMGQTSPIKNAVNAVAEPFRYVGIKIKESFEGFSSYFTAVEELNDENESLKASLAEAEMQIAEAEAIKAENERLRAYLDIKKTHPSLKMTEAMVIGSESENYMTLFTLNKGSGDGVKLGMPVIIPEGLVGSVCEVGYSWCRVRALTEASSSAGAYIPRSGEVGILEGDISLKNTGTCMLTYLSAEADVEVGDLVYTSGKGSVYPRDLLIGYVTAVETNEYLRKKVATVSISADLTSLKYVMIITDYDIVVEE
ncbi:MAG: rod shape-determining protein MreC [Clostridia bacterium]|nr:rod shape-determining protein MreC [Clostridia bacterium]